MVNSDTGFNRQPAVLNGFSDLILDLFGPEVGAHARSAVEGAFRHHENRASHTVISRYCPGMQVARRALLEQIQAATG
jgi:hypothetical protein